MSTEKRAKSRVNFERGITVRMLAIDGAWQRACEMLDVSEEGVLLRVQGNLSGLDLKEFFLVLSTTGTAHRRCSLAWVDGDRIGASFIRDKVKKTAARR
ncbi:MAG: pilus assembly protein PilZ [Afipia sp. 62-7]|nr:PilZ domain-containing protein [Afipia sp.]OJU18107.1 MAG: pilus assembly protein PilZ [Afipia sp. 62-7]